MNHLEVAASVHAAGEDLPPPEQAEAFGACFDRFAKARVVLLGAATHGTAEFYRARAAITRRLVERHGFGLVAVEFDWTDAARIDRHVRHRDGEADQAAPFDRFPGWIWRNAECADFVAWLRQHNEARAVPERVELRGLDLYGFGASMHTVLADLEHADPRAARLARHRHGCLTPWQRDSADQGRMPAAAEGAVAPLCERLAHRLDAAARDAAGLVDVASRARILRGAEHYYRALYRGGAESWNLRAEHMFETLQGLLRVRGPDAKAVVWAHNAHIGDSSATAMGWMGQTSLGALCCSEFKRDAVLIGFGTDRGTVAAAHEWGAAMAAAPLPPARDDSYEALFRDGGRPRSLTDWWGHDRAAVREALSAKRLERAIGVVYRPETELFSHYFEAVLPDQFDAYVWFAETRAVTPLGL